MNIFEIEKLPGIKEDEIVDILKENENVSIERIISTVFFLSAVQWYSLLKVAFPILK